VADEPGVEPHAIGGVEPYALVDDAEAGRCDGLRARQAWEHGHIDEALLQRHQRGEADHHRASHAVGQRLQPSRHIFTRRRRHDFRRGDGRRLRLWCRPRRRDAVRLGSNPLLNRPNTQKETSSTTPWWMTEGKVGW
jgi:hypothetical protein